MSADAEVPGKAAGGFKLFGDVEAPAPPSRPPSPPRPFQLFGDIQPLGEASDDAEAAEEGAKGGSDGTSTSRSEDGSAGGETRDTVASFKAFDLGPQPMMDREGVCWHRGNRGLVCAARGPGPTNNAARGCLGWVCFMVRVWRDMSAVPVRGM